MGRVLEQKISSFNGGIADYARENDLSKAAMIKHFDIHTSPHRLVPNRQMETDHFFSSDGALKAKLIRHPMLGSDGNVYAYGVTSTYGQVYYKTNPTDASWVEIAGTTSAETRITECFFEWQLKLWFLAGTHAWYQTILSGSPTQGADLTSIKSAAQGLIGGDNNAYIFYENKVARISASSVVTSNIGPSLPSDMRITCAALWGNYIAIGMAYGAFTSYGGTEPIGGKSMVFLWDKTSTTTVSEVVDWGEGTIRALGNVEGRLVGVSDKYLSSERGLGRGSMVIKEWNGGAASVVKEIIANQQATAALFLNESLVKNNKLYWVASIPMNQSTSTASTHHLGIWSWGRKNANSNFALTLDITVSPAGTAATSIESFGDVGNYWYVVHNADGSVARTDNEDLYDNSTSVYETLILAGADSSKKKKLIGITVLTEPLPTTGQIVVKYRKDEETSYTTIFSHTIDNDISQSAINITSTGATLPEFQEIQFRLESTAKAVVTGIKMQYEFTEKDLY